KTAEELRVRAEANAKAAEDERDSLRDKLATGLRPIWDLVDSMGYDGPRAMAHLCAWLGTKLRSALTSESQEREVGSGAIVRLDGTLKIGVKVSGAEF